MSWPRFLRRLFATPEEDPRPPDRSARTGPSRTPWPEEIASVVAPELSDVLDLHTFRPEDAASVVTEYLAAAQAKGLTRVRVIHGKGIGVQRERVRALLERHPEVASFGDAPDASGWGATVVVLRPRPGGVVER